MTPYHLGESVIQFGLLNEVIATAHRLSANQRRLYEGRPSWNGKTKRDWAGLDLPELKWEMPEGFRDPDEDQDPSPEQVPDSLEVDETHSDESEE